LGLFYNNSAWDPHGPLAVVTFESNLLTKLSQFIATSATDTL